MIYHHLSLLRLGMRRFGRLWIRLDDSHRLLGRIIVLLRTSRLSYWRALVGHRNVGCGLLRTNMITRIMIVIVLVLLMLLGGGIGGGLLLLSERSGLGSSAELNL